MKHQLYLRIFFLFFNLKILYILNIFNFDVLIPFLKLSPIQSTSKRTYNKRKVQKDISIASSTTSSIISRESTPKASTTYTSILSSPNRLKDVKAKLAAPVPVGKR